MSATPGPVRRQLEFLLNGFNFYGHRERVAADDLLVRSRAGEVLSGAGSRLDGVVAAWRDRALGPGVPSAEQLAPLRAAQRTRQRLQDAETMLSASPLAHADRTWARLRTESGVLDLLLQHDLALLGAAQAVRQAADGLRPDALPDGLGAVDAALERLEDSLRQRGEDLAPPC